MAVTTSFSLAFIKRIDIAFASSDADVTALANGGFVGIGEDTDHVDGTFFNPDSNHTSTFGPVTGALAAIDQLTNGNLVIVGQDLDSVLFTIVNSVTGATVVPTVDLNDTNSSDADVAALTGGRFVIVNQDFFGGGPSGDNDIDVTIRNADGSAFTSFTIDTSTAIRCSRPCRYRRRHR